MNYTEVINDIQRAADSVAHDEVFGLVLSLCSVMNHNLNTSQGNFTINSKVTIVLKPHIVFAIIQMICICLFSSGAFKSRSGFGNHKHN